MGATYTWRELQGLSEQDGVRAICLRNDAGLELVAIPDRALDVYKLSFAGIPISYTAQNVTLSPDRFREDGAKGFSRNFFAGMLTTCGLIQSGRPCVDKNGRSFGLHGCISNTRAVECMVNEEDNCLCVYARMIERHPEGEAMCLERTLRLRDTADVEMCDQITNIGERETPLMLMYHINFGAPFLGESLRVNATLLQAVSRDTWQDASVREVFAIFPEGSASAERVYYAKADLSKGVRLENTELGIACDLYAHGENIEWLGVWKNFVQGAYALGIEPGNAPGVGRVEAKKRGLLHVLQPGASHTYHISLHFQKTKRTTAPIDGQ